MTLVDGDAVGRTPRPTDPDPSPVASAGEARGFSADVVLIPWPEDDGLREVCRRAQVPRLLLVADGAEVPDVDGCLEDWAPAGAGPREVAARRAAVARRAAWHDHAPPALDADGLLHHGDRWVALPPVEARLVALLISRYGQVVTHEAMAQAGWPDQGGCTDATLRPSVFRLRRRIAPIGLELRTIHARGYLLEADHHHR